ncbi:ANTH-domain-containing protein [Daedalea quercina L-15889]|uniref:ANTH-domain-containing protein n=1 Tax=Daedalea quercina L-15889 TaxID=1314783 RepID=A0A165MJT4_9APHY|nr:ANTH-domain-containing protein [Daedalea quercina L-15889]
MTSFEKAVKGACKPKQNPPKAKYLDPILAATWSEDGAVHDVCRALIPRFREPNTVVVFKALIVLHMMIRNGSTDNVLSYLSSSDVLKLKNISSVNWEGYDAPQNVLNYATYLDSRIRAYSQIKHDAIRVQSENNRDMRNSAAIQEELGSRRGRTKAREPPSIGVQRSKTLAGRKLRVMTVEKGLLRETKIVQRVMDALLECRFYLDDLDNELNITALRMLVKDLLILFQACNEGVINVLEHYFEMFRTDAEEALNIYRHFCKETERVVEYLGVAKKLQNILNVPIPNLRHAPVSLAGALEEYLRDPNFEQNRIEYKANKQAAERAETNGNVPPVPQSQPPEKAPEAKASSSNDSSAQTPGSKAPQDMVDFFSAIEGEQQNMFNPQTNSPSTAYFQQHALHNPFAQQQMQMMTGAPFGGAQPFAQLQMQPQPTGFVMPQHTSTNPFGLMQQQHQQQQQPPQQPAPFLQPQHTSFLQPQATGANPFRQSMLLPQMTGMAAFGQQQPPSMNPFPVQSTGQPFAGGSTFPQFNNAFSSQIVAPAAQQPNATHTNAGPARPASAPLTAIPSASGSSAGPPPAQPVKTHQTGSRNPFGVPVTTPPPVPKQPTLFELAMGAPHQSQQNGQPGTQLQTSSSTSGFSSNGMESQLNAQPTGSVMAGVASSFTFNKPGENSASPTSPLNPQQTASTTTGSTFSNPFSSPLSTQPTGATATSSTPSISVSANTLQPQKTGFSSGLKPFKPSSSFGAALLESLPPIPQSAPTTPGETTPTNTPFATQNGNVSTSQGPSGSTFGTQPMGLASGLNSQPTGAFGSSLTGLGSQPTGSLNSQPTGAFSALGKSPGVGLRPQMTGATGGANPFRASMFPMSTGLASGNFGGSANGSAPMPSFLNSSTTGAGSSQFGMSSSLGAPSFGSTQIGQPQQKQQQNGSTSLI